MAKRISPLQQLYFAWDLTHKKSVSDDSRFAGILSEAKVDLNPHQVEAALFAFKSPLSKGAILADEVGLGKTIEAGIILSEMWAEHKRNILIIVPASLRNQWNIELMEKFFLPSTILLSDNYSAYKSAGVNPLGAGQDIIVC
jgi:SNF2 family DNA or RNA helicase